MNATSSACCRTMFAITMKTARTWASERKRQQAEVGQRIGVASFLDRDWAACITVTIELRNNRGRTHRRTDRSIARLMCVSSYVAIQASAQSSQSFEHTPYCHVFLNYGPCR